MEKQLNVKCSICNTIAFESVTYQKIPDKHGDIPKTRIISHVLKKGVPVTCNFDQPHVPDIN